MTGLRASRAVLTPLADARLRRERFCVSVARGTAFVSMAIGVVVLLAWAAGWEAGKSLLPGAATMKPLTAVCFVLLSVALLFVSSTRGGNGGTRVAAWTARACAATVVVVGLLTALAEAFDFHLGLDTLLFRTSVLAEGDDHPGRMSGATAQAFLLFGLALSLFHLRFRGNQTLVQALSTAAAALGLLALVGYVFDVNGLYSFSPYASMALHTALLFVLTGAGVLLSRPGRGWMAVAMSERGGGLLARRMLPVAIVLPVVLGGFCLMGARAGAYEPSFGMALFALASILVLTILIWSSARAIDRLEESVAHTAALARSKAEDLRLTLESIGEGVITTDTEGNVTLLNPVAEALTGWSEEEAMGRPLEEVFRVVGGHLRVRESPAARVLLERSVAGWDGLHFLITRDGTELPVVYSGAPIRAPEREQVTGAVIVFRDRTEEHARMRQVQDSEQRFRTLVNVSAQVFWKAEADGSLVDDSPSWRAWTGQTYEEWHGWGWLDAIHPEERERLSELWSGAVASGEPFEAECRIRRSDGSWQWNSVRAAPVSAGDGTTSYWVGMNADISERKRSETAMQASLLEKENLLREIHHRVKNNMQVISSILGLQAERIPEPGARIAFDECKGRVRCMALVHERLYEQSDTLATLDFGKYLRDVAELVVNFSNYAGAVRLSVESDPIYLDLDTAVPVSLILNELITNALKYAFPDGRGGSIRVALRRDSDEGAILSVEDDGIGLPADLDWKRASSLGLKMVRILTKQVLGRLEVDGAEGARFHVHFPIRMRREPVLDEDFVSLLQT